MASSAVSYAREIEALLPGDPGLPALRAAAAQLDLVLADGGQPAEAVRAAVGGWRSAQDALWPRLREALVRHLPLEELRRQVRTGNWSAPGGIPLEASLGPLSVRTKAEAQRLVNPRDGSPIVLGPVGPTGASARLDAGAVNASGRLSGTPTGDGVGGALSASVGVIQAGALASLTPLQGGGTSFLAVLSAGFTPGLQLGFGFQVNRVGGVLGVERRLDPAALAARIADGSAASALFPLDAGPGAERALEAVGQLFPPAPGSAVAGPTLRLSWLEVAGQGFASVDLGVVVELPGPRRIAVVGVVRAGITPVLRLRADIAGVVDLVRQTATVDAALVDSGALGIFTIHGDLAFASCWGPQGYTVLSLGGFYPGFTPEPAQLRPLRRLGMSLDSPLPGLRLRAEGYLAATSNTLQVGGSLEFGIDAVFASLSGFMAVDALVQFTPFHISARVAAGFRVRFLGRTFAGVRFDGALEGPGPVTVAGRVTIETFIRDLHWSDTFTFGPTHQAPPSETPRPARAVADQAGPGTLRASRGTDAGVVLRPFDHDGDHAVVSPAGGLAWSQHVLPLDTVVDRVEGAPFGGTAVVNVRPSGATPPTRTGEPNERFAPGLFRTLTAAQALAAPTYEALPSGVEVAGGAPVSGPTDTADSSPRVLRKVRGEPALTDVPGAFPGLAFPAAILALVHERDEPARTATTAPAITVVPTTWHAGGRTYATRTQALSAALTVFAGPTISRVPVADADARRPVVLDGIEERE